MWDKPVIVGNYIIILPGNKEDYIRRPTRKLTKDVSALFLLLFAFTHTGVDQYGIHNSKEYYDEDSMMVDVMSTNQDPVLRRIICMRYLMMRRWRV